MWALDQDASWTPAFGLSDTSNSLEGLYNPPGLETPQDPPGCLGYPAKPTTAGI